MQATFQIVIMVFLLYFLLRNLAVLNWRLKTIDLIYRDLDREIIESRGGIGSNYIKERYAELPSYETMLFWRFWRWPLDKFTPKTLKENMEKLDNIKESA